MLDKNSLSQLNELKASIEAQKEYAEGTVAGTSGRFGFVRLDDGRDAFLTPDKMQHVLPGDRVRINVVTKDDGKLDAELEKLLESDLGRFMGTYRVKGPAHFVEPDLRQFNRWLFIPPKMRGKAQDGDLVAAELGHHPFKDGKASATLLEVVGRQDQPRIEHKYIATKFDLNRNWSKAAENQAAKLQNLAVAADEHRQDLQDIPFVTIDNKMTRDMDDAVAVEASEEGWQLNVAIADPASFITQDSPLGRTAQQYTQTLYLPGGSLSMLPPPLATEVFSLVEATPRPALVCRMNVTREGVITQFDFRHGIIRSRAKLAYSDVADFLSGSNESAVAEELQPALWELDALANARVKYRRENALVSPDQPDFDLILDERGKIADIQRREKTGAHRLIEEAMLATNISAGQFLAEHKRGLFAVHAGFRHDRLGEVRALLKEELPDLDTTDVNELAGHMELIKFLEQSELHSALLGPLRRMMRGSELSADASAHLGMGLERYATITSPIRRFADLYNHWAIRSLLYGEQAPKLREADLEKLQQTLLTGRHASRQLEQWLVCQYLKGKKGMQGSARIRIVTPKGFGARFEHNGIDGFVSFDKKTEKSFDAKRMTLTVGDKTYRIGDLVDVKVSGVEMEKRRVKFEELPAA